MKYTIDRRHITLDSNQNSLVFAEFELRSLMYEEDEYTFAHWARHEFRLYKALSIITIKRTLKASSIDEAPKIVRKWEKITEISHQSTPKLNVVYRHGFGHVLQAY